ncbi:MAG: hypothetical protein K9K62_04100 [Desulfobacteraceae bacterium]|nr:hypothetical protein [Desulfobacteraceae bacterium]MCF8036038.1 hypothetical protein [Desulfobacteraceae bacterium]
MPAERITIRKIREVLRLKFECGLSNRQIANSISVARSTVGDYVIRAKAAEISWPLAEDMDDGRLEQLLFCQVSAEVRDQRPPLDFPYIHKELRHKGVTLMLLWHENKAQNPQGYQYSRFCHLYRQWCHRIDPVMRQEHRAGEIGPNTAELVEKVMKSRIHPQQGFRSCRGIMRLGKSYDEDRLEAAVHRANTIGGKSYKSVESILKNGLDRKPLADDDRSEVCIDHDNIRGQKYYQ